ncbi:PLP-dependent aminotransferase family protein [Chryseomicrobium sp. FSL W7-1435]|uniref:MocR-like pyridoxine biosynthesis transcription factor PdxR n=1 Tax=Chryseomicrobium sp. FSL W7-1435 TaxID=2921704 RepID=UPI00315AE98A
MEFFLPHLSTDSSMPLYERLYRAFREAILTGQLAEGEKLPSKRQLADYLSISQTTIETTYHQLVDEGYVLALPRKGYFVQNSTELIRSEPIAQNTQQEITAPSYRYDFHPGKIDLSHFPLDQWRKCARDVLTDRNRELLHLGHPQGDLTLRQQIASYLYQSRGVRCTPEQVIIGSGTEQLLPFLLRLLGDEGVLAIEDPGYSLTHHFSQNSAYRAVPVAVDEEGMQVSLLWETAATAAYITPAHQFPTGAILSASRRNQLLKWASETGGYIIEDDYDSEFRYVGMPIPALQGFDTQDRVIYLSTFSKSLMPSLRIAYTVVPLHLLEMYRARFGHYAATVPRFDQATLTQFMALGYFEKHVNRMRKLYKRKLDLLHKVGEQHREWLHISGDQAGMHVIIDCKTSYTGEQLRTILAEKGIRISALDHYRIDRKAYSSKLLLGFGGIPDEQMEAALQELFQQLSQYHA